MGEEGREGVHPCISEGSFALTDNKHNARKLILLDILFKSKFVVSQFWKPDSMSPGLTESFQVTLASVPSSVPLSLRLPLTRGEGWGAWVEYRCLDQIQRNNQDLGSSLGFRAVLP